MVFLLHMPHNHRTQVAPSGLERRKQRGAAGAGRYVSRIGKWAN